MFVNPMWDSEAQRIGKQKCTPIGSLLHVISDYIGFIAILCLLGVPIYLVYSAIRGNFEWTMLWFVLIPFAIAVAGKILHDYSWYLAGKKGFKYDGQNLVST